MGWTFTSAYDGSGVRAFLDRQFECDNEDGKWEILKSALVRLKTYYAACRWTDKKTGRVRIFAVVALVKYNPKDAEGLCLGWKEMTEDMGPFADECPLSIRDLLDSVATGSDASEWRERVRAWHARRKAAPEPGDIVVFDEALSFTDGSSGRRFRCERFGRRGRAWRNLDNGGLYRISNIARRDFVIERKEISP
ncbi:DUF6927 domain-containing protein [Hyphococcus luteus]|nr:hypothetical protein [Marinicaulis flavus]